MTTIDGEVVVCDDAGVANFDRLQGRAHDRQAFLYAFDLLELDGEDWRPRPLYERKADLHGLLRWAKPGIRFNEHLRGDGAEVFAHACKLGFEGHRQQRLHAPVSVGPEQHLAQDQEPLGAGRAPVRRSGCVGVMTEAHICDAGSRL